MAMSMENDRCTVFNNLSSKFSQLMYGRKEGDGSQIKRILEEINQLDYRYPIVTNTTKAVLLVHQCCSLVPPDDFRLVPKCCQLITNLIDHQHVQIEGQTLNIAVQWCLQAAKQAESNVTIEILTALNALLHSNVHSCHLLLPTIISNSSPLLTLAQDERYLEITLLAVRCLEACVVSVDNSKNKVELANTSQLEICGDVFLKYLTGAKVGNFDDILYCKLLMSCLRSIQNIIVQSTDFLAKSLGLMLGISKTYMVFGIKGIEFTLPQKVLPSILSIAEQPTSTALEKKGGKIAKQRKHRTALSNKRDTKKSDGSEWINESRFQGYVPVASTFDVNYDSSTSQTQFGNRLKTSDSDFSDTENGRTARLGVVNGRVRQTALNLLLHIVKLTDKHTIFCHWSSLIPDGSSTGVHNLVTCILKDPSPKGRMAALNVLLVLLTSSKLYLAQAESSEKYTAYTPFSIILGSMVKDLHKYLSLALNENSIPVLTQVLKCLAALVQATPYHRLTPGITSKVIRNVKIYTKHRDATVQVAALIVLGCVLASEPVVPETREAFLKQTKQAEVSSTQDIINSSHSTLNDTDDDIEYVDFSSDEEENIAHIYSCGQTPWLLERCLRNLGVHVLEEKAIENIPSPVKLESLQVISAMTRNYLDCLVVPYFGYITKALDRCLSDNYADLRLHAGRTIDFIGQATNQHLNSLNCNKVVTAEQGLVFWQTLINSSLTSLLQSEQHAVLRAVGCDCLGSIGPQIFEHFARDKQILMITLLFACSHDEENSVRAAAVRALAICVLYPSLREDPGFVVDVAESIHRTLQDDNMTVRIKASWSLGNLSDALVLNASDPNVETIPDSLLLRLLQISIKVSGDNDKIRVNVVRALGNLLQLITSDIMNQKQFREAVGSAIDALIKNSTTGTNMKVRWNSCYAIGNILKNSVLYPSGDCRKEILFNALMELVMGFRNFKVRINAALALACPTVRDLYGPHFYIIWASLLKALENTQNVEDFSEYNHRDHLVEQICLTLGHMASLLAVEDITHIRDNTIFHLDTLKLQMHRVLERLVPEKSTVLLVAATHLNNFVTGSNDQKNTLKILAEVFTSDFVI